MRHLAFSLLDSWQHLDSRADSCSRDPTPSLIRMWHSPTSCVQTPRYTSAPLRSLRHDSGKKSEQKLLWTSGQPQLAFRSAHLDVLQLQKLGHVRIANDAEHGLNDVRAAIAGVVQLLCIQPKQMLKVPCKSYLTTNLHVCTQWCNT